MILEAGRLYLCRLRAGTTRRCRYGYHRKNNPDNWSDPPKGSRPSCVWYGWRDNDNFRFIREEEVEWFVPIERDGSISLASMVTIANKTVITPRQLEELEASLKEFDMSDYDLRPTDEFLNRSYSI